MLKRLVADALRPIVLWQAGEFSRVAYEREFRRSQFLNVDELEALQFIRLRQVLRHAYRSCSFYRARFDRLNLCPDDIRELKDLALLPVVEKQEMQIHQQQMVAKDFPSRDMIWNQTGGSSGEPISFVLSRNRHESRMAASFRHNGWAGMNVGDPCAFIWGAPRDKPSSTWRSRCRRWVMGRQLWLDTGNITQKGILDFNGRLQRFRPRCIIAYASGIAMIARYLRECGITPYSPHSIITSAEVLTDQDRRLIEQTFGCPIFNRYGSREFGVLASECDQHDGLHTMAEGLFLEIVRDGNPVSEGEIGSVVVTDLLNFAMPMIRYRIGDVARFSSGQCPCGRGLPRLQEVGGRVTDFLVGSDDRLVSGVFLATYVVAQRPSLGQVRLLQDEPGRVTYQIKRGELFRESQDLEYLRVATAEHLGPGAAADFEFVDAFPTSPSGKLIFSRSTVSHPLLNNR